MKNNRGKTFVGVRPSVMRTEKDKQNDRQNLKSELKKIDIDKVLEEMEEYQTTDFGSISENDYYEY